MSHTGNQLFKPENQNSILSISIKNETKENKLLIYAKKIH